MFEKSKKKPKIRRREIKTTLYKEKGIAGKWGYDDPKTKTVTGKLYYHYKRVSTRRGVFSLVKKLRKLGYKVASFDVPRYISWEELDDPKQEGLRWVVDHAIYTRPAVEKREGSVIRIT